MTTKKKKRRQEKKREKREKTISKQSMPNIHGFYISWKWFIAAQLSRIANNQKIIQISIRTVNINSKRILRILILKLTSRWKIAERKKKKKYILQPSRHDFPSNLRRTNKGLHNSPHSCSTYFPPLPSRVYFPYNSLGERVKLKRHYR